jgi:acetyltransferase
MHISELATVPDLAIVCAPLRDVAGDRRRTGNARHARGDHRAVAARAAERSPGAEARKAILDAARPRLVRVLGAGQRRPGGAQSSRLNASVAPVMARRGKIALVVQSAAIAAAALDHAAGKGIGFSAVVHLGAGLDVDLADVLDWLAEDPETEAILVQFETAPAGRKFMSAARAAARNKPVVAMRGAHLDKPRRKTGPFAATTSMKPRCAAPAGSASTRWKTCSMPPRPWRGCARCAASASPSSATARAWAASPPARC